MTVAFCCQQCLRKRWDPNCATCTKIDEGINAVTCIQHYLLGEVDEIPMHESRDWCVLMHHVHEDDGTYVMGMRSITHPDCVAPVHHPTTSVRQVNRKSRSKSTVAVSKRDRTPIAIPANTVRPVVTRIFAVCAKEKYAFAPSSGAHGCFTVGIQDRPHTRRWWTIMYCNFCSNHWCVIFIVRCFALPHVPSMSDMKLNDDTDRFIWEHWLRTFILLREAACYEHTRPNI